MSAATRKSSQNRRIITSSLRPSVSDSGRDYNSKLRCLEGRVQRSARRLRSFSLSFCGCSRVGCKKRGRDTRATTASTIPCSRSLLFAPCYLLLRKPVLRPGIGRIAVAADFPETRLIFGNEFNRANKLGPFPCIQLRDDDAGGATMIARNRFAVELGGHERIVIECVFNSDISGVAIVAAKENMAHLRFRFHNFR